MPQSLAKIYLHLVFSTKSRASIINDRMRDPLHGYMATVLENLGCHANLINSVEDHIHLLFELGRTVAVSKVVEDVKKSSSKWIKTQPGAVGDFGWQNGYGVFSVSHSNVEAVREYIAFLAAFWPDEWSLHSNVEAVREYIASQREHHRHRTFQDELWALLEKHGVDYDERYVWD